MAPDQGEDVVSRWIKANSSWLLSIVGAAFTVGTVYYQVRNELATLRKDIDANTQADASARSVDPNGFASPGVRAGVDAALRKFTDEHLETKQHAADRWARLFELNPTLVKPGGQ